MTMGTETRAIARAALAERIDVLGREVAHLSPARIAFAVDDIRREARNCRLDVLAALASNLERDMATSGGTAVVLPYLEAMGDALVDAIAPARADALLASVALRLHG